MYIVKDIIEPDFGCEGLPEGEEICCEVILEDKENGNKSVIKVPDAELYKKNIDIGSQVRITDGKIFADD